MLHGLAQALTVNFPWASLLRGVLGHDEAVLAGVASLLAPGAEGSILLSVVPRDGVPAVPPPDTLAAAYARRGLSLVERAPRAPRRWPRRGPRGPSACARGPTGR